MATQFCNQRLNGVVQLVQHYDSFMLVFSGLHLTFSLVAFLGNLLVIHALRKASMIPANLKKLFLSLSFSDLAVGLFPQLTLGIIVAVMLKMATSKNHNFDFFCPIILNIGYFAFFLLACVSFLNVTAIGIDRLLAVSLHLRYQELVTSKRVTIALVSVWLTSGTSASIFISLSSNNNTVVTIIEFVGLFLITVAYIRIYKVVRYHQNQIQSQLELANVKARQLFREKKSALNSLMVCVVFLACFLPNLCSEMLLLTNSLRISFLVAEHITFFLVLLNSSLNPLVYAGDIARYGKS